MEDRTRPSEPEKGVIPADGESQATGMLRDIAIRWFMETQAPLILQDGTLPEWFHGFITRKQAEELLRDKPVGCFLIRLSDKAMGYILSYRGYDRCRHFVISQLQNRKYIISGDTCNHPTLTALISYYQEAKIEPFGESLTTACPWPKENNLYDAISHNLPPVIPPESTDPSKEKQELGDLEYLRSAKDRDPKASPTPKPRTSYVHSKKFLEECPWKLNEEDTDLSAEAPPLPERGSSLLMESFSSRHSGNIIYAELKKMNHSQQGLSMEASDIPHQSPFPGREYQRKPGSLSGELVPKTRDAPLLTCLSATNLLGLDPNKKSPPSPYRPTLEDSSPVPISTSPGDKASSPHHQASPKARCSPESKGSSQGFAIHAVPQPWRGSGSNGPRDSSPPGTHELMPKVNHSFSLEVQAQASYGHDYEPVPARLPKSAFLPLKATYNQLEGFGGWMDNAYEKISGSQSVSMTSLPSNPYEQVPILKVQETKQSHSHKVEKYRRFFFTDRKNKQ
ncbi:SH2 domain-containing protein 7 [Trichosurus vulpecula]|uniref:SH2 domain-containing protein 7 n=1 Tax=Trichosurus vulpecula TaxID=9337 RepID=UPI00186ADF4F|nr:SH2 domain-containing protein 7 [Trichosurus vulpecula]